VAGRFWVVGMAVLLVLLIVATASGEEDRVTTDVTTGQQG
jgi:hypothetical protein